MKRNAHIIQLHGQNMFYEVYGTNSGVVNLEDGLVEVRKIWLYDVMNYYLY